MFWVEEKLWIWDLDEFALVFDGCSAGEFAMCTELSLALQRNRLR